MGMTDEKPPKSVAVSSAALNRLRAAVLGANDGIVSTSSVVMGVAAATNSRAAIFTAGMAALVAGALSMAVGEYVSVSSQSDAEKVYIEKERRQLANDPDTALEDLAQAYVERGVNHDTALKVAQELTAKDALKAHLNAEFNLDEADVSSPVHAAVASLLAFTAGGLVPFLAIILAPGNVQLYVTIAAVLVGLLFTGYFSATMGGASRRRAIVRVVAGGLLAMAITYAVGKVFGATVS